MDKMKALSSGIGVCLLNDEPFEFRYWICQQNTYIVLEKYIGKRRNVMIKENKYELRFTTEQENGDFLYEYKTIL